MKKSLVVYIFVLVMFWPGISMAQENRFLAGFRYGFSLPMGQFASHEYKYGAYALLGTTFTSEAVWYFYKGFGAGANFSASYYPIASGYYAEDLDIHDAFGEDYDLKSGPYTVRTYMAGACYRLPVYKRFSASFKALGGLFWAMSPDQFYGATFYLEGPMYWRKTSARSSRFTFLTGAALNYRLFENVTLLLETEFTYAESRFPFIKANQRVYQYMKMPLFKLQPGINITF